ncbi:hypothetical protein Tco_0182212, partial [Tanacetum coccineum]
WLRLAYGCGDGDGGLGVEMMEIEVAARDDGEDDEKDGGEGGGGVEMVWLRWCGSEEMVVCFDVVAGAWPEWRWLPEKDRE